MPSPEIHFYFPIGGAFFLVFLPLVYGQWMLTRHRKHQEKKFNSFPTLQRLLTRRSYPLMIIKMVGWILTLGFICITLMNPFGNIRYTSLPSSTSSSQTSTSSPHAIIFLVDTSASMLVADSLHGETRLETAKKIVEDVIRGVHGQMVSLYAFTSQLTPVVPMTMDYLFTRLLTRNLQIDQGDVGGTQLGPVLTSLKQMAFPHPSDIRFSVILLSDGGDNELESLEGKAKQQKIEEILSAIPNPEELHLHMYTVGIGSEKSEPIPQVTFHNKPVYSKLEEEILQRLAAQERGSYFRAQNWSTWDLAREILLQIQKSVTEPKSLSEERKVSIIKNEDILVDLYYQIPLGIALMFYCLYLLLPDAFRGQE